MTPADPSLVQGASVGELLQQVEDQFYRLAVHPPSARALLTAWPDFAASCAHLLQATIGPAADQLPAQTGNPDTHPVLPAASQLMSYLRQMAPTWTRVVPDPTLLRAAQLIGAAGDLVEAARDRRLALARQSIEPSRDTVVTPNRWRQRVRPVEPDPAVIAGELTDGDRLAAVIRATQHALAGVQLIVTAGGSARANSLRGAPTLPQIGSVKTQEILHAGTLAARVLAAGEGVPAFGGYDAIRVPTAELVDPSDLLARLRFTVHAWKQASTTSAADRPSIAEALRSTVEIRHLIGLNAALTHTAAATGQMPTARANDALTKLLAAQQAWGQAADRLAAVTDGITPSPDHVAASIGLADAVRAITRSVDGGWRAPADIAASVPLAEAMAAARTALHDAMDVARIQQAMTTRLILLGGLYARARNLRLTPDRVEARVRDGFVPLTLDEVVGLRQAQVDAITNTDTARRHVALMHVPGTSAQSISARPGPPAPQAPPPSL